MMDSHAALQGEVDRPEDEITRYLAKGLYTSLFNYIAFS